MCNLPSHQAGEQHTVCPGNPAPLCAYGSVGAERGQTDWPFCRVHFACLIVVHTLLGSIASGDLVKGIGLNWRNF